jgi:hypothetical protein
MNTEVNPSIPAKVALAEKAGRATMKLFRVKSVVKSYDGCRNVPFSWFIERGKSRPHRPYGELIENYDRSNERISYAEAAVDELFTLEQAEQLKDYLDREFGDGGANTNIITEATLPMPNNTMGVGSIPVGGGDDFYMLDKTPGYPLPFKVQGYFNLVGCKLEDGSDVYRHRLYILCRDGLRMQTNSEAAAMEREAPPPSRPDAVPF